MKLKELDRTVNIAWSPSTVHPIYLAAGTAAQQLDASFSTTAAIEVYSLNLTEPGLDMQLRGSTPSDHRFHKIVWGNPDKDNGVIVGGCDGGRMQLYNAFKLLSGEDGLIDTREKHTGPVQALDFNPFQGNLLASGASESDLLVWDLNNLDIPMKPGPNSQPLEDIVWVSWNRQVQHILASVLPQRCVMWDLRKNEPIIKISDSTTRIRWKVAAWNPQVATQLCICSEEDQNPVIQLWDLRFATSPLKVLQHHQRGVLSIAWCEQDPDILASCGKENHILFWNPNSNVEGGEVICDITTTYQWNFDVSWCPRNPALFSSSSFDGHVSVYSLTGGQQQIQTSTKIADSFPGMENFAQAPTPSQQPATVNLHKAPKWMKKPVGVSFSFGGKLVTFGAANPGSMVQGATTPITRPVYISQVVTEPELISRSNELEQALQYGQFAEFCQLKASVSKTLHEQSVWNFMKASFEDQPRVAFLRLLGFKPDDVMGKLNKVIDKPANAKSSDGFDDLADQMKDLGKGDLAGNAEKSFDAIAAENRSSRDSQSVKPFKIFTGDDTDGLISQALLLGYVEAAVELCLQNGRMADAIILAATQGADLLARTQERYLKQSSGYVSALIGAVVTHDWTQVIQTCEVESWKEAMAAILTQVEETEEFPVLCEKLGLRLEAEGKGPEKLNAQLCYICAGNLNKLVENWTTSMKPDTPNKMQDLVELVMMLRKAAERRGRNVEVSGNLASFLSQYATMLTAEGSLNAALTYLGDSNEPEIVSLRERLQRALGQKPAYTKPEQPVQQQPQVLGRIPTSRRESASYYGPGSTAQNFYQGQPTCLPQPTPPAPTFRPTFTNAAVTHTYSVPKTYTPPPSVPTYTAASTTPSVASASQGSYRAFYPSEAKLYEKSWGAPSPTDTATSSAQWTTNSSVSGRKPYVVDPSVRPTYTQSSGASQSAYVSSPQTTFSYPGGPSHSYPASQVSGYSPPDVYSSEGTLGALDASGSQTDMSCWNDPPAIMKSTRNQPKTEYTPRAPITHPLYGSVSQEILPPSNMPGVPMNGGYGEPIDPYGQQHQQFQPQVFHSQSFQSLPSMQSVPQQHQQQPVATARVVEAPKPKGPLPEEHMYLQTVFDELRNRCFNTASNPQSRRKLEDVAKKLEVLYDALRENKLSPSTLQGLHQMVQMVQIGDYAGGLNLHTQLVSGPDFSKIASFMPGLKVLLQLALQLQVFVQ